MAKSKKIENEANFSAIQPEPLDIPCVIDYKGSGKWVKWGKDNKMPQYLYDCFLQVSNLQSILQTYFDFVCGAGIESNYLLKNSYDEDIKEVIEKAIYDYLIFGCFSLECIRSAKGDIADVIYQDVRNVRVSEDMTTAYLASDWGAFYTKDTKELPLYNKDEVQSHFIYFYNGNARGWYGTPIYFAALKSIEILKRARDFHLNNLRNNFSANAIITFCNGVPSKTVQEQIYENINNSFCGTENTSKLYISFADNKDSAPTVERLTADDFGDLYHALTESSTEDIYAACRINKMLLGANVETGFSRQEINEIAGLFNTSVIEPLQKRLTKAFDKLGLDIRFNKYEY